MGGVAAFNINHFIPEYIKSVKKTNNLKLWHSLPSTLNSSVFSRFLNKTMNKLIAKLFIVSETNT